MLWRGLAPGEGPVFREGHLRGLTDLVPRSLADVVDWHEDVIALLRAEVHGAQPQARDFQAGTAEMCVLYSLMLLLSKSCVQQVA